MRQLRTAMGAWRRLSVFVVVVSFVVLGAGIHVSVARADPFRSILVHFTNNSDSVLTLYGTPALAGCWSSGIAPAQQIAIGQSLDIGSESCGVLTGTEFFIDYQLASGAKLRMHYDNPALGSNSYEEVTPQGYAFARSGGDGNNAELTVSFGCNSATCDGIPDDWKKNGVTIDPGGGNPSQLVDLPKMGVSLDRPNVLVQLDWMQDATHNQQLSQAAIDNVIRAYDQNPVTYRGATRSGITLIVDAGPNSTIAPGGATWGSLSRAQAIPWAQDLLTGSPSGGYQEQAFYTLLKNNFVPTGRLPIFHYAAAAAEIVSGDSTSGLTPGNKLGFMVTLGDWTGGVGSTNEQTGTFMHELGHTLGLQHGGQDGVNFKPNYPSIMNYLFQTVGVPRNGARVFDYSRDDTQDVDETKLTEAGGVSFGSNPSGSGTGHNCPGKGAFSQTALSPVDWSCDGITPNGGTGFDANGDGSQTVLKGSSSDWSRIQFKTGGVGAGSGAKDTVTIPSSGLSAPSDELTLEMARLIRVLPLETKLSYLAVSGADYNDPVTVSARLVDLGNGNSPITGKTISFQIGSSSTDTCTAQTDPSGTASCQITISQNPGTYSVTASFAGDTIYKAAADSPTFKINQEESKLAYTGLLTSHYHDALTVTATLTDPDGNAAIPGKSVTFALGVGDTCTATTDVSGKASCSITPTQKGTQTIIASFAGDTYYVPSGDKQSFSITPEETTMTYTGPKVILAGASGATLTATLVEDGTKDNDGDGGSPGPLPAETVTLSVGSQSCTGTTNASGLVSCTIPSITLPLGPVTVGAAFAGDAYYQPSSDSASAIVFAFPSRGAFVLGDTTAAAAGSGTVTWWGAQWWKQNQLSGGTGPAGFKGFAAQITLPTTSPPVGCGSTWTTGPGNSSAPVGSVPSYMGVVVASTVSKSGSTISGNSTSIVVVKVDPGYAPNPGSPGTGTIVAKFC